MNFWVVNIFRLMTLNDGIEFLKIYTQPLLTIKQHSYKAEKRPTIVDWLTKAVAEDGLAYSPELSEELLLAAGGDIDMYRKTDNPILSKNLSNRPKSCSRNGD